MSRYTLTLRFKKVFIPRINTLFDAKYYLYLQGEWVEVDRNLYIDLMAMTDSDKVVTVDRKIGEWVLDVNLDRRRTRIFKLVAKSFYNVEL